MSTEQRLRDYLARATDELRRANQRLRELESTQREPVAIIAAACRFPGGADTPEQLWQLVSTGGDAITPFPRGRGRDLIGLPQPGRSQPLRGGFLPDTAKFDPAFFGISPREATVIDPQQRLLLETAWEAVERATIVPADLRGREVGVFIGATHNEYGSPLHDAPAEFEGLMLTGTTPSVASGRIAYTLGLTGPAVTIDTACSSSLVATHLAVRSLRERECTLALAGGATVLANTGMFDEFSAQHGLAADGRCKPFSDDADGTVWSEGVGLVLLERLSDAQRNGHPVLAVILGSAINQDGASNGLTAPRGAAQEEVIRRALADAGLTAADIDAVEAHGTGTALGDPIEAHALQSTYGIDRPTDRPLQISAIKSSIGHTQAAAGIAGVVAMTMAMRAGSLPWISNFGKPSRHIDWSAGNVSLLTRPTQWIAHERPRRAGISSFGISGTNAHLILEEAPARSAAAKAASPADAGSPNPIMWLISGASDAALRAQAKALLEHVQSRRTGLDVRDVGYSLAATRSKFEHRAAVIGSTRPELERGLAELAGGRAAPNVLRGRSAHVARTAFLFSGQGSQRPGMGSGLYRAYPVFARTLDGVLEAFDPHLERGLREVFFAAPDTDDCARLDDTAYTQPALFALEVALYRLVESFGLAPDYLIGHSIGELAAAHVAGVFSLEDAARLVAARGRLMAATRAGAMASIEASEEEIRARLDAWDASLSIAAVNAPVSTVVSGEQAAIEAFAEHWRAQGRKATRLRVRYAFHSPAMDPVLDELTEIAKTLTARPSQIPLLSNVTGTFASEELCNPQYWADQARSAVRFMDGVRKLAAEGTDAYLELGPVPVLTPLVLQSLSSTPLCVSALTRGEEESHSFIAALGELHVHGAALQWPKAAFGESCSTVDLPTYQFQRRSYWLSRRPHAGIDEGSRSPSPDGHPLLGRRVELAGADGVWFAQTFEPDQLRYLTDHRVLDRPLLPAAAMVEWALAAANAAPDGRGTKREAGLPATINEVAFAEFLPLSEKRGVAAQAAVRVQDGRANVRCFARSGDSPAEAWTEHVTAWSATTSPDEANNRNAATPMPLQMDALSTELDRLPVDTFYGRWERIGLRYGPSFRGVREVWQRGQIALARIETPRLDDDRDKHVLLHPVTLDCCFQLFAAFAGDRNSETDGQREDAVWVPVSLDRITVYQALPERAWCKAALRAAEQDGERVIDLTVLTESGEVLAAAHGLRFRAVDRGLVQRTLGPELRRIEVEWMALDDGARPSAGGAPHGPWLVFSECADLARRWRAELAATGVTALALVAESASASGGGDEFEVTVDPDSPESVLASIAGLRERGLDFRGLLLHGGQPLQSLSGESAPDEPGHDEAIVEEAYRLARHGLHLLQGFLRGAVDESAQVVLCSTAAADLGNGSQAPDPGQAVFTAMAKAVTAEYPDLKVVQVDLDPGDPEPSVAEVMDRAISHAGAGHLAVRGGQWFQAELHEHAVTGTAKSPARPDATYLITGGFGALGLEVASWLARHGAGTLLLVGRTLPPHAAAHLDALRATGARIECQLADIADDDDVTRLFEYAHRDLPPLGGVVHAAGVLDDGALADLDWDRFRRVLDPKVRGSLLLHRHTKDLDLDFFVLFSSLVSLTGAAGQSDYLAANAFMDALAAARRQEGLPALSVGWGPWTGAGMAAQRGLLQRFAAMGVAGFPAGPALEALAKLTSDGATAACAGIAAVDWSRYTNALSRRQPYSLLSGLSSGLESWDQPHEETAVRIADLARTALTDPDAAGKAILAELLDRVATLLHIPAAERDELRPGFAATRLSALGLDSLTTIQLRGRLLADFGTDIAPSLLFGSSTAAQVAEAIREQIAVRALIAADAEAAPDDDDAEMEVLTL